MNRPKLFNQSIDRLAKAFINNTLRHGDCMACAVGNMLQSDKWKYLFVTINLQNGSTSHIKFEDGCLIGIYKVGSGITRIQRPFIDFSNPLTAEQMYFEALDLINESGYSIDELQKIENTFEVIPNSDSEQERMFNGLMAVVDVLAEIHEVDLNTVEESRLLFQKA